MTLQTLSELLAARRDELRRYGQLQELADRLQRLVVPLTDGDLYLPDQKALLSRDGGICASDGSRLMFDPMSPEVHVCPRCGREHRGIRHFRAWVWRYHIWLSERAIHLALLGSLRQDSRLRDRAQLILERYAAEYRNFPNSDNVLGPTRLFFSTYLESIWLTQVVIAAQLLRSGGSSSDDHIQGFDAMVRESAQLIASFDEGWSNRQVWNNTALIAAGIWLGGGSAVGERRSGSESADKLFLHGLDGPHGIRPQLVSAVTDEGLWFEGENYHFFALRGFLLAAELVRTAGIDLYGKDGPRDRLRDMLLGPLRTIMPDLTLPARGDSPYGVSILQPRFAELWELGWQRTGDHGIGVLLKDMYSANVPIGADPGFEEMAEQEQNRPPQRLHRELLGWKALLLMSPVAPDGSGRSWKVGSTLLPQAGIAVLRTRDNKYVSVECGGRPGGHGHPDLLHLTVHLEQPLLMDFGTASYVNSSLDWYRSTLAHNAPAVAGEDQRFRRGWCSAIDQKGGWSWCRTVAEDVLGPGTTTARTVVVAPDWILDIVEVATSGNELIDLPLHLLDPAWGSRDGWLHMSDTISTTDSILGPVLEFSSLSDVILEGSAHTAILPRREGERIMVVERPGPPDSHFSDGCDTAFMVRRANGAGRWIHCFALNTAAPVSLRSRKDSLRLEFGDGSVDEVSVRDDRCRIIDRRGKVHRLGGARHKPYWRDQSVPRSRKIRCPRLAEQPRIDTWEEAVPRGCMLRLGAPHYRRSERPYGSGTRFQARVAVFVSGTELCFGARVVKRDLTFRRATDRDPGLDNETADIHSDGVQCYWGVDVEGKTGSWCGCLLVPDPDSELVRAAAVGGTAADIDDVVATWAPTPDGYSMLVAVDIGTPPQRGDKLPVNIVVNEMYSGRQRRAGQLALSGGGWVYLRGDREPRSSALLAEVM